jgi:hypothetical protein
VYIMLTKSVSEVTSAGALFADDASAQSCLNRACEHNVFEFLTTQVLKTATYQV